MRWFAAAWVVISLGTASAQTPARDRPVTNPISGTARLQGRVVAAATGDPIRHAVVALATEAGAAPATLSDEEGRFGFAALPAGKVTVSVSKPGFATATVSAVAEADRLIATPDAALLRGSVLSGVLLDELGEPVPDSSVAAIEIRERSDGRIERRIAANAMTDDGGAFRFGSLAAGTYAVTGMRLANDILLRMPVGTDFRQPNGPFRLPESARYTIQVGEERSGVIATGIQDRVMIPAQGGAMATALTDPRQALVVRGRVTIGGQPAGWTVVQLLPVQPAPPVIALTDTNGRFELAVANGREDDYRIVARKIGYAPAEYGAPAPNRRGALLHMRPGEVREDLEIALTKLSAISGRILDDFGEPVQGALVKVAQLRFVDGQRKLIDASPAVSRTDDLGRYRLSGLRRGQYALVAAVGQVVVADAAAEFPGYGVTFFPGTTNPGEIQLLSIGVAQELIDLDFRLVKQRTFRIAGHASDSTGDPVTGGISLTARRRSGSVAAIQMGARIDRSGGFEFRTVPAGEYVLQVTRGMGRNPYSEGEFAYRFIDLVDADVLDLEVQTAPGSSVTGRVLFDGGEPPSLDRMELSAVPVDLDRTPGGQTARARFDGDRFEIGSISGPRRIQVPQPPPGWMLKAVIAGGIDVTDEPLPFGRDDQSLADVDVVLTNRITRLSGRVITGRDALPTDFAVLAFSSRQEQWYLNSRYLRRAPIRADGTFAFDGLPPGDYYVLAGYPPEDPGEWRDPDALEKLALQAARARLPEGQQVSVELRVR